MVVTAPFSHPRLNAFPLILKRDRVHSSRNKLVLLYKPETPYLIRLLFGFSLPIALTPRISKKIHYFNYISLKSDETLQLLIPAKRVLLFIFSCEELNQVGFWNTKQNTRDLCQIPGIHGNPSEQTITSFI